MIKCDFTVVFYGIDFNAPNQKYDNLMTRCPIVNFSDFFLSEETCYRFEAFVGKEPVNVNCR